MGQGSEAGGGFCVVDVWRRERCACIETESINIKIKTSQSFSSRRRVAVHEPLSGTRVCTLHTHTILTRA